LPRGGFTLIELLIALTIVSLLMAITVPMLGYARERAYITSMQSDLRNLAVMEESYFYDHSFYTANLGTLEARGFLASRGVTVEIREAVPTGWSATVSHIATPRQCHLFVGAAAPVGSATEAGVMDCG
jgi:prepilin-type N-terminal cleavage/methylation domain-containing protein